MRDKDELERQKFERWLDENSYNKQRDQMGLYEAWDKRYLRALVIIQLLARASDKRG